MEGDESSTTVTMTTREADATLAATQLNTGTDNTAAARHIWGIAKQDLRFKKYISAEVKGNGRPQGTTRPCVSTNDSYFEFFAFMGSDSDDN